MIETFKSHNFQPPSLFYLGESVLLKAYRGQGIGVRFFEHREAHAHRLGGFSYAAFCAVRRGEHPRRPKDYVPLDEFWRHRGYTKHPELITAFSWKDIDEEKESLKPMEFWLKQLNIG